MTESERQLFPLVLSPSFFSNPEFSGRPALAFSPVRIEEGEGVLCGFNKGVTRTHGGEGKRRMERRGGGGKDGAGGGGGSKGKKGGLLGKKNPKKRELGRGKELLNAFQSSSFNLFLAKVFSLLASIGSQRFSVLRSDCKYFYQTHIEYTSLHLFVP